MIKKNTLFTLMLLITTLTFAQQIKTAKHHWLKDTKRHFSDESEYEYLPIENYLSYKNKQERTSLNTLKNATAIQSLDSLIRYSFDLNTSQWFNQGRTKYTYNSNEKLEVLSSWDENTSQWNNFRKYQYNFDTDEKLTLSIQYNWDANTNQWINYKKREYFYDTDGKRTVKYYYSWDANTNQWTNSFKVEYSYDANEYLQAITYFHWDSSTNQWLNSSKNEYFFDADGNLTLYFFYQWDSSISQWMFASKTEYTYDVNGNRILIIRYNWDLDIDQWINDNKTEYSYDANGNRILEIFSTWDLNTNNWLKSYKKESNMDLSINLTDLILPWWYPYYNSNKILDDLKYNWNDATNSWELSSNGIYYYSDVTANVNQTTNNNLVTVYPNPANNNLHITLNNNSNAAIFNLFDIQGKKLITQNVINNEPINISHLNAGMYLYSITTNGKESRGKLLKK